MTGRKMEDWKAWDALAQSLCDIDHVSLKEARDRVIMRGLKMGDPRPFYDWVLNEKHEPSQWVVLHLARMIAKAEEESGSLSLNEEIDTPYGLKVSHRDRGNQSDIEVEIRNYFIARETEKLRSNGDGYDSAIAAVRDWLPDVGVNVSMQTVRDASDSYVATPEGGKSKIPKPKKKSTKAKNNKIG